jgi:hypothetical protein
MMFVCSLLAAYLLATALCCVPTAQIAEGPVGNVPVQYGKSYTHLFLIHFELCFFQKITLACDELFSYCAH